MICELEVLNIHDNYSHDIEDQELVIHSEDPSKSELSRLTVSVYTADTNQRQCLLSNLSVNNVV